MSAWHSLYVFTSQPLQQTLAEGLTKQGFTRYDPFNTFGGAAYPQTIRLFLAKPVEETVRILVEASQPASIQTLIEDLSACGPCLSVQLDGVTGSMSLYHEGQKLDDWTMIARRGVTTEQIEAARQPVTAKQPTSLIPIEDMPTGLQAMAQTLSNYQVGRLFQKMAHQVMSQSQQTAAERFLQGLPRWDSLEGYRLISCMALLRVPKVWREPDFPTLRTAYWLHIRRRTQPNAPLMPGDENALRRVPDALSYTPFYGGKV